MAQWSAPSPKLLPLIPRYNFAVLSATEYTRFKRFSKIKFVR